MRFTTPTVHGQREPNPQFIVHLGDYIYEQTYDQYYLRDSAGAPNASRGDRRKRRARDAPRPNRLIASAS